MDVLLSLPPAQYWLDGCPAIVLASLCQGMGRVAMGDKREVYRLPGINKKSPAAQHRPLSVKVMTSAGGALADAEASSMG
jgi:hypothetical protein